MRNRIIQLPGILFLALSNNAYSHTGAHSDGWLQTTVHFITSPEHLFFIIPAMMILGLVVRRILAGAEQ